MTQRASWAAVAAAVLGLLALGGVALGPALAYLGVTRPFVGFVIFALGFLDGLLALVLGGIGLARTRATSGRPGRGLAWIGVGVGAAVLVIVVAGSLPGRGKPRINDITTNPGDPPAFRAAARDPANAGRDLAYPREFAAIQRAAYPDLTSLLVPRSAPETLERAKAAATTLGWEIVEVRPAEGVLEAREVSGIFRFVDDVVVRVRPGLDSRNASIVDVRSKSRDGQGDLGANADRIEAFNRAMQE